VSGQWMNAYRSLRTYFYIGATSQRPQNEEDREKITTQIREPIQRHGITGRATKTRNLREESCLQRPLAVAGMDGGRSQLEVGGGRSITRGEMPQVGKKSRAWRSRAMPQAPAGNAGLPIEVNEVRPCSLALRH